MGSGHSQWWFESGREHCATDGQAYVYETRQPFAAVYLSGLNNNESSVSLIDETGRPEVGERYGCAGDLES